MMDILLTQEQEDAAIEAFCERYRKQYGGRPPQVRIDEERRRAQVQKVAEWLYGGCDEHEPSPFAFVLPVPRIDCVECLLALKAAVEGK